MYTAFDELVHSWCGAEDLEAFEHVVKEAVDIIVGPVSFPVLSIKSL